MSEGKGLGKKKILTGEVIGNKMQKTIIVRVIRHTTHPLYKRVIVKSRKYKVHDEKNEAKVGDRVDIIETRPISKEKCWRLLEVLNK